MVVRAFLLLLLVLAPAGVRAQDQQLSPDLVEEVRSAMDRGDSEALIALADERLEVGLFGAARLFSRGQAQYVLRRFFRDHPPLRLTIQESVSTDNGWFAAGDYHRLGGRDPHRVYLRMRLGESGWTLREIVILDGRSP